MPVYKAPMEDIKFVLHDLLNVEQLATLPGYEDATADLIDQVLEEGAKIAENELQPLNQIGDQHGCILENGVVRTPPGFKEAYDKFIEGGWTGISADPEYGGQGLPKIVNFVMEEVFGAANMSFSMYPGLSHGAHNAIEAYGDDEMKALYLPKLIDGSWAGTMCLTEPHCGTDLGLIRTKAVPEDDGSYKITGTKIFISAGEHDLTENILHLVLAKLPDAPTGVKGISLFLVPKFLPRQENGEWKAGMRNGISCGSIEHKMGIKGSSTCVMNMEDATGWLVGEKHKGMRAMFVMMNAARLGVAMQGLSQAEVAYQNAALYARERVQGRGLDKPQGPSQDADPIIVHPDVRKNLLTVKSFTEGMRALAYWIGIEIDRYSKDPDPETRQAAEDLVALMTPILKAYGTDVGFDCTNTALQVFGGHGYVWDHGMEQFVRDARIAMIYEGANGIQALDLIGRKVPQNMGRLLRRFFHPVDAFIKENARDPGLAEFIGPLTKSFAKLQQVTAWVAQKGMKNPLEAGGAATDYLKLFSLVALAYMWARIVKVSNDKKVGANGKAAFYENKVKTARFFYQRVLPQSSATANALMSGVDNLMALDAEAF